MSEWKECPKCKGLNKNRESCVNCGRDLKDVAADKPLAPATAKAKPDCSPLGLLAAWERARNEYLNRAFEGCDMTSRFTPMLQIAVKESFDAGWSAAIKYLGAANDQAQRPAKAYDETD